MKTISEIQVEQHAWAERNFVSRPAWHPLLGIQEECGELSHAYLKRAQGIRGTKEEHDAAIKDAIGDIMIYLMDFCTCAGLTLDDAWFEREVFYVRESHMSLAAIQCCVGMLSDEWLVGHYRNTQQSLVACLKELCAGEGIDLISTVNETWDTVSKRDWTKNKIDGT